MKDFSMGSTHQEPLQQAARDKPNGGQLVPLPEETQLEQLAGKEKQALVREGVHTALETSQLTGKFWMTLGWQSELNGRAAA
jgi:hypothetical protein